MMKRTILLLGFALAVSQAPQSADAQGKGEGKGQGRGQSQAKGQDKEKDKAKGKPAGEAHGSHAKETGQQRGRSDKSEVAKIHPATGQAKAKGARHKFTRIASPSTMPQSVRLFAASRRPKDVIVAAAVSHAFARGRKDDFRINHVGNEIRVLNLNGDRLIFLDDDHARDLGRWRVGLIDDNAREGSPSFCRSGAGHPVWGREWCLDKGFGLGSYEDFRWGRTNDPGDIVFTQFGSTGSSLIGNALASVLGTNAFNRLALHAVTLGLVEPLVGRWVSQSTGPQLLMVNSGQMPVAELVDVNRDNRADNMLVALRPWYY